MQKLYKFETEFETESY